MSTARDSMLYPQVEADVTQYITSIEDVRIQVICDIADNLAGLEIILLPFVQNFAP